jgi:hypothetical protein
MEKFMKLSRAEMKNVLGGVELEGGEGGVGGTSCSADCPAGQSASITNCNGTCTGYHQIH